MESLLTTEEVAEWLRVDVVTVRRLVSRGGLTAYRVASEYRFQRNDLDAYLTRQRVNDPEASRTEQADLLTGRARNALTQAQAEARRFTHNYVDAEHLLLALVRDPESIAALVLHNLRVEPDQLCHEVEQHIRDGQAHDSTPLDAAALAVQSSAEHDAYNDRLRLEMDLTLRVHKVLQLALDEAIRFGRRQVGTGQLLLGILREDNGLTSQVLRTLGVTLDKARTQTAQLLTTVQHGDD